MRKYRLLTNIFHIKIVLVNTVYLIPFILQLTCSLQRTTLFGSSEALSQTSEGRFSGLHPTAVAQHWAGSC